MFETTPINPELVHSIDQVYELRNTAINFFCGQRVQQLVMENDVDRARLSVAFIDVLLRSEKIEKVLILSRLTKILEQVQLSVQLHTSYSYQFINKNDSELKVVNFITYKNFLDLYGYQVKELEQIFANFDLIIVDDIEDERHELFKRKLNDACRQWVLAVSVPEKQSIAIG